MTPPQEFVSYPGTPASAMVGTSGNCAARLGEETPRPRTRPAFACGPIEGTLSNIIWMLPETRSLIACGLPLYGTCRMSVPVMDLNSSAPRWPVVPLPEEPVVSLPGYLFA